MKKAILCFFISAAILGASSNCYAVPSRYWVGGGASYDWNDTVPNTWWASTTGGANDETVPINQFGVFFDGNSGAGECVITADVSCGAFDTNVYTGTVTQDSGVTLNMGYANNDLYLGRLVATDDTSAVVIGSSSYGGIYNASNLGNFTINSSSASANTLQTAFSLRAATTTMTITRGTLNTNGQAVTIGLFSSSNALTRALTLGASTITVSGTGTVWDIGTPTNMTLTANTSTIKLTGNGAKAFNTGGLTYNNLDVTGTGTTTLSGAAIFNNMNFGNDATIYSTGTANLASVTATVDNTGTLTLGAAATVTGSIGTDNTHRIGTLNGGATGVSDTFSGDVFAKVINVGSNGVSTTGTGTLAFNGNVNSGLVSTLNFGGDGVVQLANGKNLTVTNITNTTDNNGTLSLLGGNIITAIVGNAGTGPIKQIGLSGGNATISGITKVYNASLAGNTLTTGGEFTIGANGTISTTVASATSYGYITAGANAANVPATATVTVNVTSYIPNGTVLTIVDGTGGTGCKSGVGVTTTGSSRIAFSSNTTDGAQLTLTANRTEDGFASVAANSNEAAVGAVLDSITNPSSDMTTILNTMEGLNNSQTDQALNSMEPDTDGAALQVTQATLDQLTDAVLGRQESLRNGSTGVSSGTEMLKGVDVWAQAYGSYLHQDPRQSSQGYNANIWGTALGFDLPIIDNIRAGTCFGFAQDYVRGKDNSNRNDINSYQWTIYGEYAKDAYYIDLSGSFAYNTYDASRQVAVGAINRTALADYNGQQYAAYIEGGYTFTGQTPISTSKTKENRYLSSKRFRLTPVASFQYQRLNIAKYVETGANAMNLSVKSQSYDLAQTGFGIKLDYPLDTKYGKLVPELRFKWLYDWIGDSQATTSTFNGGGGSFATNGFTPAQSSWNFGVKLTLYTKSDIAIAVNYDLEFKDDFYGHYGYINAKYSF